MRLFLLFALLIFVQKNALAQSFDFDFSDGGTHGFSAEFRDIPLDIFNEYKGEEASGALQQGPRAPLLQDVSQFPQEQSHWLINWGVFPLPDELKGEGFLLQGNNHSDDMDMFMIREFTASDGIIPGKTVHLRVTVDLAGDAPIGGIGAGGNPELAVQAIVTDVNPHGFVVDEIDNVHFPDLRLGPQQTAIVGTNGVCLSQRLMTLGGGEDRPGPCPPPGQRIPFQIKHGQPSDELVIRPTNGRFWLMIGTGSGFEGFTGIYYTRVRVQIR